MLRGMNRPSLLRGFALAVVLAAPVAGCKRGPPPPPPPPFQKIVVATLPFDNASASMDAPVVLRNQIHPRIARKGYLLQPLPDTDAALQTMGIQLGGQIKGVEAKELREKLGADYALWGTVHESASIITGIYNRRTVDLEVVLTDLRTGQEVWRDRQKVVSDDDNLRAKTGLDVLSGVVRGVAKGDMTKEHVRMADVVAARLPWCPREPLPPPPPPAGTAPGASAPISPEH